MGGKPSFFEESGPNAPVGKVSWDDAQEFCRALSERDGREYRLPTEAEWEYACRAGSTSAWCFGDDETELGDYAWYNENSDDRTHPVGQKKPNAWGIHDMHGNVWEWCSDWNDHYPDIPATDPLGPEVGSDRVLRGGSGLGSLAEDCRSAYRFGNAPGYRGYNMGFRVAVSSTP